MRELYSLDAEFSLIGALMLDSKRIDDVSSLINPSMFFGSQTGPVYRAILDLAEQGKPIDAVLVAEHLEAQSSDLLESVGGLDFLVEMVRNVPGTSGTVAYAEAIKSRAKERDLHAAAVKIQDLLMQEGLTTDERFQEAEAIFTAVGSDRSESIEVHHIADVLKSYIDLLEHRFENPGIHGIKTGFTRIDERLQGLKPGELYIFAARPGMGKTTFALNVLSAACLDQGKKAYFSSLEMPAAQLVQRLIASNGNISLDLLKSAKVLSESDECAKLTNVAYRLKQAGIMIDDQAGTDINDLRSRCRRQKRLSGLDIVFVDYLQLLEDRSASGQFDVVSNVSRKLKGLAKELECAVVALSQLSRSVEQRTDKRPILSDLRSSGQIEQDADVITFLYRDEIYNEDSPHKGIAEVITAKFRDGEGGTDHLAFIGAKNKFADLEIPVPTYEQESPKSGRGRGFEGM